MQSHPPFYQSSMQRSITDTSNDEEIYELCAKHPNEVIKFFCSKHDSLICGHCLAFDHRSCSVILISELSKSENGSVNKDIVDFITDVDEYASEIENSKKFVTQISIDEVRKLREYRNDIEQYFDQRIGSLLENIQLMKSMDETLLDSLKPKCDHVKSKAETLKSRLNLMENTPAKLFIETKRAQTELAGLRSTLADMHKETIIHEYRFNKDSITEKLLASKTGLGKIKEKHVAPMGKQLLGMRFNKDSITEKLLAFKTGLGTMTEKHVAPMGKQLLASCCCITKERVLLVAILIFGIIIPVVVIDKGYQTVESVDLTSLRYTRDSDIPVNGYTSDMLLLPDNRLILADWNNKKVEMIDMRTNDLMFAVSLPGRPHRMAILPGDRLAVCFKISERIQFLKTLGQFSLEENIKVDGKCLGIGYHKDRLIVSYTSGKVEIMDMTGNVIKTIDKDDSGQSIFRIPFDLNVVSEVQTAAIYVSDFGKSTITKLDMDLNTLQTFQDPALTKPTGITAVGNQLLICGWASNNIMSLDMPSGQMTQLLGEVDGIKRPGNVCYYHKQNKMYVTLEKGSAIKVYYVDWSLI